MSKKLIEKQVVRSSLWMRLLSAALISLVAGMFLPVDFTRTGGLLGGLFGVSFAFMHVFVTTTTRVREGTDGKLLLGIRSNHQSIFSEIPADAIISIKASEDASQRETTYQHSFKQWAYYGPTVTVFYRLPRHMVAHDEIQSWTFPVVDAGSLIAALALPATAADKIVSQPV